MILLIPKLSIFFSIMFVVKLWGNIIYLCNVLLIENYGF